MTLVEYFRTRRARKIQEAYQDGYGWAWAAWRIEGVSLQEISDFVLWPYEGPFKAGAIQAMIDIEQLTVHKLPLLDQLVSPE